MNKIDFNHKIFKPIFIRKDKRGDFIEIINKTSWKSIIYGNLFKNAELGNHYHKKTKIFFYIISGKVKIFIHNLKDQTSSTFVLNNLEGIYIFPYEVHRILCINYCKFIMLKSIPYNKNNEDTFLYK